MELYRYALWNFEGKLGEHGIDQTTHIKVRKMEDVVLMPNAFYLPLMNGFEVLPIQDLGVITNLRAPSLTKKGKEVHYLNRKHEIYLPYADSKFAVKEFAEVLERCGYKKQAKAVRENGVEPSYRVIGKSKFTRKEINYLKKYDSEMGWRPNSLDDD